MMLVSQLDETRRDEVMLSYGWLQLSGRRRQDLYDPLAGLVGALTPGRFSLEGRAPKWAPVAIDLFPSNFCWAE